jgi:glutamate-1-semialdehyde aminotransferase
MEPIRNHYPKEGFLETIRQTTAQTGIILVFDEVTAGWRLNLGGAHLGFSVNPDIAVFAKAISNGYPMAAVIGKPEIMQSAQDTFISSTYWTEKIGPVAALATIRKLKKENVSEHLIKIGKNIQVNWKRMAQKHNLKITISGIYPLSHFSFDYSDALVLKTLFTQLMLERGFLATTVFYASYAHKDEHVNNYLEALDETFGVISEVVQNDDAKKLLKVPVCHAGFRRLN